MSALITQTLLQPERSLALTAAQWDLLVRQGRRANLLGKLAAELASFGLLERVPQAPRSHLFSALAVADQQARAIRWEVRCIHEALAAEDIPAVLLKGAAYVMAELPPARGRVFSDVDILVPKERIDHAEAALIRHGWSSSHHDAYYQRYYRQWMHEIPPLMHQKRGTVIDVHHAILPLTARIKVNTSALWDAPVPLSAHENFFILQPIDMVLHSAAHLFHEGELHNGLRDLFDLDALLRHFGKNAAFWADLLPRARDLGLERPLFYALRYTHRLLGTPMPEQVLANISQPAAAVRLAMDFCYMRALQPEHASCRRFGTPAARFALYVRSHWLRMPFFLLAYHLSRKALLPEKRVDDATNAQEAVGGQAG
jgi:hypothetical protein